MTSTSPLRPEPLGFLPSGGGLHTFDCSTQVSIIANATCQRFQATLLEVRLELLLRGVVDGFLINSFLRCSSLLGSLGLSSSSFGICSLSGSGLLLLSLEPLGLLELGLRSLDLQDHTLNSLL